MDKLDAKKFLKSKIVLFVLQVFILSMFIHFFSYEFIITFDIGITKERQDIIQFLANYVMYEVQSGDFSGFCFIYISWLLIGLLPVLLNGTSKKSHVSNLTSFFFLNFFFYVFLSRYSPTYFNTKFPVLFLQTIVLGIIIMFYSVGLSIIIKKVNGHKEEIQKIDLKLIEQKTRSKCPSCGTEFDSIPRFCYKCSKELVIQEGSDMR